MGLDYINRVAKITFFSSLFCFFFLMVFVDFQNALSFFVGSTAICLNLIFFKNLAHALFLDRKKNVFKILLVLGIKFPLLYFVCYELLTELQLPAVYFMLGTTLIFFVMLLSSVKSAFGKTALVLLAVLSTAQLHAGTVENVPEVPNLITFIYQYFHDAPWAAFLHEWETIIFSLLMAIIISISFYLGVHKNALIPTGWQNFVEWTAEHMRSFFRSILGDDSDKYIPLLGTLFIYILCMNWLALVPLAKAPTSSLNITIALAICVFVLVQYLNFKNWGFWGFMYHMAGSPKGVTGWLMVPLMFPIEVLTQLTRPITLSLRLFGNILGEDILLGAAALFGVYLLSSTNIVGGFPMQLPIMFLSLLTGLMQALVFTILTAIYILLSKPGDEDTH